MVLFGGTITGSDFYADTWTLSTYCRADFQCDGTLNSQDFFDFLNCFFNPECDQADFNRDEVVNSQDFFDFLAAFFVGC